MISGAVARIALRYVAGALVGMEIGDQLAMDPDLVLLVAAGLAAVVEGVYAFAKRHGWRL